MVHKVGDLLGEQDANGDMCLGHISKVVYDKQTNRACYCIDWIDGENPHDIWSESDINYFKDCLHNYLASEVDNAATSRR